MNWKMRYTVMLVLLLCVGRGMADVTITHNIGTMIANGTLVLSNNNQTGTTDLFAYNCTGTAKFEGMKDVYNVTYPCLYFKSKTSVVTTSKPIKNLYRIRITHIPYTTCSNLQIYISTDGENWGDPLSGAYMYSAGQINISFPQSDYYIRFKNNAASEVGCKIIEYFVGDCDCKALVVE